MVIPYADSSSSTRHLYFSSYCIIRPTWCRALRWERDRSSYQSNPIILDSNLGPKTATTLPAVIKGSHHFNFLTLQKVPPNWQKVGNEFRRLFDVLRWGISSCYFCSLPSPFQSHFYGHVNFDENRLVPNSVTEPAVQSCTFWKANRVRSSCRLCTRSTQRCIVR